MPQPKALTRDDNCPQCGGRFEDAPVPTTAERAAAAHRDDPRPLPPHYDTAPEDFRTENGALARCTRCTYVTRFPIEPAKAEAAS